MKVGYTQYPSARGRFDRDSKTPSRLFNLDQVYGFPADMGETSRIVEGRRCGIYNDLGEFATFIVDAYARRDTESIVAAFGLIEELLVGGDGEVRTAAAIGFLEGVRNSASWRPFGATTFVQWLGPKSKAAWAEIEEMWRGKKSLADVVRAERAAKTKPKL